MRKNFSKLFTLLVVITLLLGCATQQKNAYKILVVSHTTYDTVMKTAGDLYKQNKINDDQKDQIILIAESYKEAHNTAVTQLLVFKSSGKMSDEESYLRAVSSASLLLSDLINLVNSFGGK